MAGRFAVGRFAAMVRRGMANPLVRHNLVFFLPSGITGLTGYLLSTTLARQLPPGEYSQVGVTLNAVAPLQPIAAAIAVAILRSATENRVRGTSEITDRIQRTILRAIVVVHALLFAVVIVAHNVVSGYFHLTHPELVYLSVAISAVSFVFGLFQATLQERKQYRRLSLLYLFESVARLIGGVIVIALGFGVTAVLWVYLLSAIALIVPLPRPERLWRGAQARWGHMKPILRDMGTVTLANLGITLLITIDVTLCRKYLDPVTADRYVVASVAKFFGAATGWAGTIAFRHLVEARERGEGGGSVFVSSFGLIAGLGVVYIAGCALFGQFAVSLAYGAPFRESGTILWITALSAVAVSLIQLETAFFNAIQWPWYLIVFVGGSAATVLALPLAHGTLRGYATVYAVGTTSLVLILFVLMIARFRDDRKSEPALTGASTSLSVPPQA